MLKASNDLFNSFTASGVVYCHWKSNEHLREGLDGITDLDVLISVGSYSKCIKVLETLNFKKCNIQFGSRYSNVEEWLGFDSNQGNIIHLHLHQSAITGKRFLKEYTFPWSDLALDTAIKKDDINIMEPNLELVTLFSRIALKNLYKYKVKYIFCNKFQFDKYDREEICYLQKLSERKKIDKLLSEYFPQHAQHLSELFFKTNWKYSDYIRLRHFIKTGLKSFRRLGIFNTSILFSWYACVFFVRRVLNKILPNPVIMRKTLGDTGKVIAFVGSDGTGKSTITNDLLTWLGWKLDCRRFYLGSGDHYNSIFKIALKFTERFSRNKDSLPSQNGSNEFHSSRKLTAINYFRKLGGAYFCVIIAKKNYNTLKRIKNYSQRGGIALLDRFPQSQFAGIYDGPKLEAHYKDLLMYGGFHFLYTKEKKYFSKMNQCFPDIVFKLILSPEISVARKPDHDFKEVSMKAEITKQLNFQNSEVYDIDANQNYQEELLEIKRIIWQKM